MNTELALEKIEACMEMLLQIKADLVKLETEKVKTTETTIPEKPKKFIDDGGAEHNAKEPYISKGVISCCGNPCEKLEGSIYQCKECLSKYRWS